MSSGTKFDPPNQNYFDKSKLNKSAQGIAGTATAGVATNFDYTLSNDVLMAGGTVVLVRGGSQGDSMDFQVLSGNVVIATFVDSWFVNPDSTLQQIPPSNYPAKLFAGLTLRVVYNSIGSNDSWVAVNYNLEKVLE